MKVLLAVDHSDASKKAVAFAGQMLGQRGPAFAQITLFHVVESLPEFITSRSQHGQGGAFSEVADAYTEQLMLAGRGLLDESQAALVKQGVPAESIEHKLVVRDALPDARRVVATRSIIEEMTQGNYEVVVLGRRGASGIETFLGSVAEKVLREAQGKTVWIVD